MATIAEQRAADADRERVVERLRRAQAEGRIDVFEFDERVAAAYAARTYGELDPLTADLPPERVEPGSARPGRERAGRIADGGGQWGVVGAPRDWHTSGAGRSCGSRRTSVHAGGSARWAAARRAQLAGWLVVGLLNVLIWAAVSLTAGGGVYPWWVWVVGPWGVALMIEHLVSRLVGAPRRPAL